MSENITPSEGTLETDLFMLSFMTREACQENYSQVGMSGIVTPAEGTFETCLFYYIMNTFAL